MVLHRLVIRRLQLYVRKVPAEAKEFIFVGTQFKKRLRKGSLPKASTLLCAMLLGPLTAVSGTRYSDRDFLVLVLEGDG